MRLLLKRDDLLHPPVSGSKWRKLGPNLEQARRRGLGTLLTFGGAWSNHLRAAAAAGREAGLRTVGVVRGDELRGRPLNPSLAQAAADGMELEFLDRASWRRRTEPDVLGPLLRRYGPAWVVPEGGSNAPGVRGCATLGRELAAEPVEVVCCSVGTGGVLAGLAAGLAPRQRALGIAALAHVPLAVETEELQHRAWGGRRGSWRIETGFARRGYGRTDPELLYAVDEFARTNGVVLDPCYEGKALLAVRALAEQGEFARGTTTVLVVAGSGTPGVEWSSPRSRPIP
ncbi:1-aminocyclopropane-1-carboxylate deaminase/D-cysteine desulfhydrase [Streptacidiphilus monticola]